MFLQLLTLGAALNASSEATDAAQTANKSLEAINSIRPESHFIVFDELDYNTKSESTGFFTSKDVSEGKKFTRRSIPVSRIKSLTEFTTDKMSYKDEDDDDYGSLNEHWNRIRQFHEGVITVLYTYDDSRYILDSSIMDLQKQLQGA
jgi:hypothetical protein